MTRPAASVGAIVVAAGSGRRFGGEKQLVDLHGVRVLDRSVAAARSVAAHVVAVVPGDRVDELAGCGADVVVAGGATRSDSVRAGLAAVPAEVEVVVVHDGARPLASATLFVAVVDAVRAGADAAIPGVPVSDTLKRVERAAQDGGHDVVGATVDRDGLVAVQTPQAFAADVLRAAHATGAEATDDAALVEARGGRVVVVAGETRNLKITTPDDLRVAEALAE